MPNKSLIIKGALLSLFFLFFLSFGSLTADAYEVSFYDDSSSADNYIVDYYWSGSWGTIIENNSADYVHAEGLVNEPITLKWNVTTELENQDLNAQIIQMDWGSHYITEKPSKYDIDWENAVNSDLDSGENWKGSLTITFQGSAVQYGGAYRDLGLGFFKADQGFYSLSFYNDDTPREESPVEDDYFDNANLIGTQGYHFALYDVNSVKIYPLMDSYIDKNNPDSSFETENTMLISRASMSGDYIQKGLIRFPDTIPAYSSIKKVKWHLVPKSFYVSPYEDDILKADVVSSFPENATWNSLNVDKKFGFSEDVADQVNNEWDITDHYLNYLENYSFTDGFNLRLGMGWDASYSANAELYASEYSSNYMPYLEVFYVPALENEEQELADPTVDLLKPEVHQFFDTVGTDLWLNTGTDATVLVRGDLDNLGSEDSIDSSIVIRSNSATFEFQGDQGVEYPKVLNFTFNAVSGATYKYYIKIHGNTSGKNFYFPPDDFKTFKITSDGSIYWGENIPEDVEPPTVSEFTINKVTDSYVYVKSVVDLKNNPEADYIIEYTDNREWTAPNSISKTVSASGEIFQKVSGLSENTAYHIRAVVETEQFEDATMWYYFKTKSENYEIPEENISPDEKIDFNISDLDKKVGIKLGFTGGDAETIGGLVLSSIIILTAVFGLIGLIGKVGASIPNINLVLLFVMLPLIGFLTALTWMPIWITILIGLGLVVLTGHKVAQYVVGSSNDD